MKIAICDDETLFLSQLKSKIYEYSNKHNLDPVVDEYTVGSNLIDSNIKYDIIILDYQMDKIDGLETARLFINGINEFACIHKIELHLFTYLTIRLLKLKHLYPLSLSRYLIPTFLGYISHLS